MRAIALALLLPLVNAIPGAAAFPGKGVKSKPIPTGDQFKPGDGVDRGGSYGAFLRGMLAERRGDYPTAIQYYERAGQEDTASSQPQRHAAELYLRLGDVKRAEAAAARCVAVNPSGAGCLEILAGIAASLGKSQKAAEYFEKIIRLAPADISSQVALSVVYLRSGAPKKAIETLEKAPQPASSPHPFMYDEYFLARAYFAVGDYGKGVDRLETLFQKRPDFTVGMENLGWGYRMTGQWDKAIDLYKKFLVINPSNPSIQAALDKAKAEKESGKPATAFWAEIKKETPPEIDYHFFLGMTKWQQAEVLRDMSLFQDALAQFQLVRAASPANQTVISYIATVFESLGLLEESVAAWKQINATSGDEKKSVNLKIADLYDRMGKPEKSLEHAQIAVKLDQEDPELRFLEGFMFGKLKKNEEAVAAFGKALELNPNNPKYYFHMGVVYEKMAKYDKCIESMKKAVAIKPDHSSALNYLGYIYAEQNINLGEAEKYVLQALELEPNNGYFIDSLGWVYYKKKQYDAALGQILTAVRNITPDPTVLDHLGDVYAAMSRVEDAAEAYQRSLDAKVYDDRIIDREKTRGKLDSAQKTIKEKAKAAK